MGLRWRGTRGLDSAELSGHSVTDMPLIGAAMATPALSAKDCETNRLVCVTHPTPHRLRRRQRPEGRRDRGTVEDRNGQKMGVAMAGTRSRNTRPSEQETQRRGGSKEISRNASSLGLCNRSELHGVTDGRRPLLSLEGRQTTANGAALGWSQEPGR